MEILTDARHDELPQEKQKKLEKLAHNERSNNKEQVMMAYVMGYTSNKS